MRSAGGRVRVRVRVRVKVRVKVRVRARVRARVRVRVRVLIALPLTLPLKPDPNLKPSQECFEADDELALTALSIREIDEVRPRVRVR